MSKGFFWTTPKVEILDATDEAQEGYDACCGADVITLYPQHVQALLDGKMLAWNDSEYATFVVLARDSDDAPMVTLYQRPQERLNPHGGLLIRRTLQILCTARRLRWVVSLTESLWRATVSLLPVRKV